MKKNRTKLRNKIVKILNVWHERLGSTAGRDLTPSKPRSAVKHFHRFVRGEARGRAILIYPLNFDAEDIPIAICEEMARAERTGALVGCALHVGDAFDIVVSDPVNYPRKRQTYLYQKCLEKHKQGAENGRTEQEQREE